MKEECLVERRHGLPLLVAALMVLGAMTPVAAQRPDPHTMERSTPGSTAVGTPPATDCALVEPYKDALYSTIDGSGAFADFFYSDIDFGDVSADEAEDIIRDGNAMIVDLGTLDVPAAYTDAHKNIMLFLQINIDMARFYGVDTSVVPDIAAYDSALIQIEDGERAVAVACPDEIDAAGGYILVKPEERPAPVDPNSIPK